MTYQQCSDNGADRKLGKYWERMFCLMAARRGLMLTPMQIGRSGSAIAWHPRRGRRHVLTLPDITIWSCPTEHHEIKHKNPTRAGEFGLEEYRLAALLDFASESEHAVMYTIHNHDLSGGRNAKANDLEHWMTYNVLELDGTQTREDTGVSWVNGKPQDVRRLYWPAAWWQPLSVFWRDRTSQSVAPREEWVFDGS